MNLTINKEIAIKYHLNMHLMESFLEKDSIAFEVIKYVIKDIEANDKELTMSNFKFTSRTLKYIFGDRMKEPEFKEYIVTNLKEMIKQTWIKPDGQSMYITEEMLKVFYTIK